MYATSRLEVVGPNGIGKSTFLKDLAHHDTKGAVITESVRVGYYQQDFAGLDFDKTVFETLEEVCEVPNNELIYATAAHFLLTSELVQNKVGSLSEGQKGLLCYARFVHLKPGLLILDEPTNHINFRHIPIIAKAINDYEGAIILASHMDEFVSEIKFDQTLDLKKLA